MKIKKEHIIIAVFTAIQSILILDLINSSSLQDNNVIGFLAFIACVAISERDYIKHKKSPERKAYRKKANIVILILFIILMAFNALSTGIIKDREEAINRKYDEQIESQEGYSEDNTSME